MRPPEPVTMAMGITCRLTRALSRSSALAQRRQHERLVRADPVVDVLQDLARTALRAPIGVPEQRGAVRQVDPHVAGAALARGADLDVVARDLAAQVGRLAQREADVAAAANVEGLPIPVLGIGELTVDEV